MNLTLLDSGASGGDSRDQSTTQKHPLGAVARGGDGSLYRYVKAGAVALVPGNSIQSPAIVVNHLALTPSAAAIGATTVVATLGATAAAANLYAEGWVQVDTTPGNGFRYRVASHAAVLSAGVITATLYPDDPITVALTSSSRVGFIQNPFNGVIQTPITTATGTVVGVACSALAIANFGWVQTHGMAAALINGTPALGGLVISPGGAAGAFDVSTAVTILTGQISGRMQQIGVSGKNNAVWLGIDY